MINLSIQNFIFFFCPTFVPSGLGSLKEKGRLKASRTLWSSPRYSLLHATDPLPVCRKRLQPPRPSWVSKGRLKDFLIREEGNVETKEKPSKKTICVLIQSCRILCDSMDCSPPGSSVHGIFQARVLEQVAISLLQGIFPTQGSTHVSCIGRWILYHLPPEKPFKKQCAAI